MDAGTGMTMFPKPETAARAKARRMARKKIALSAAIKIVDERDGDECRICGVQTDAGGVWTDTPHHHHIVFRGRGGKDDASNLVVICARCHDLIHNSGRLRVSGTGNDLIISRKIDGEWSKC